MKSTRKALSWSQIACFLTCPEKYRLRYRLYLILKIVNFNFIVGNCLHTGLFRLHLKESLNKAIREAVKELWETRQDLSKVLMLNDKIEKEFIRTEVIIESAIKAYARYYKKEIKNLNPIELELSINGEIISPIGKHTEVNDKFYLKGQLDELVQNKRGYKYVYEIKTTNKIDKSWVDKYVYDGQTSLYINLAQLKHDIRGVYVDCIKKPALRIGKAESENKFLKRLEDFYINTHPEDIFYKDSYRRNLIELENNMKMIYYAAENIMKADKDSNRYYRDRTVCHNYNSPCEYLNLCNYGINQNTLRLYYKSVYKKREVKK